MLQRRLVSNADYHCCDNRLLKRAGVVEAVEDLFLCLIGQVFTVVRYVVVSQHHQVVRDARMALLFIQLQGVCESE